MPRYSRIDDLRRSPEIHTVRIEDIKAEEFEPDGRFTSLWAAFQDGSSAVARTRISRDRIDPGFYRVRSDGGWEHYRDELDERSVSVLADHIRAGQRPTIFVYLDQRVDTSTDFMCPDDTNTLEAYALLGITKVPAIILDPAEPPDEESVIYLRGCSSLLHHVYIERAEPAPFTHVASVLGRDLPSSFREASHSLLEEIDATLDHLRLFHRGDITDLHYHHTLSSVLARLGQTIRAMRSLLDDGFFFQAVILLRTMYEMTLTLYLDWLAPEQVGPLLQYAAAFSRKEWLREREVVVRDWQAKGLSVADAEQVKRGDARSYDMVAKVAERARLNPMGSRHKELYAFLSRVAHQDFTMTARFAHTLEQAADANVDAGEMEMLIRCADLSVAQVSACIRSDMGPA